MANAKRGRGSRRGVYVCAVAALGFALSGCGGGGSSSSAASATQSSAPAQSSTSTSSATTQSSTSTQASASTQGSTPTQSSTSTQGSTATQSSSGSGGAPAPSSGSGSSGGTSPTASATSVTINWIAPTENTDGTALTNLAGYAIHYGTASHSYTQKISINTPGLATYVVQNLTPGTYYFAVAAVNSAGTESPLSSEVSATVN